VWKNGGSCRVVNYVLINELVMPPTPDRNAAGPAPAVRGVHERRPWALRGGRGRTMPSTKNNTSPESNRKRPKKFGRMVETTWQFVHEVLEAPRCCASGYST
jgi:hypothetical protein